MLKPDTLSPQSQTLNLKPQNPKPKSLNPKTQYSEIMYGGHITDKWDRRTCVTYLETLVVPDLYTEGHELFLGFKTKIKGNYDVNPKP